MNCRVPDFGLEGDNPTITSKIPGSTGEDIVELLWPNGPVFLRRTAEFSQADYALPRRTDVPSASGVVPSFSAAANTAPPELFMGEGEMASWLYCPLGCGDDPGGVDVDPPQHPHETAAVAAVEHGYQLAIAERQAEVEASRPPLHPAETRRVVSSALLHAACGESTVVGSSVTPALGSTRAAESRAPSGPMTWETGTCERGPASSSGFSSDGEAAPAPAGAGAHTDERKRKGREDEDSDSHSEDTEFESIGKRKDLGRPASTRRPRAAEVHNMSERRRRDRINERMKALQQLIPRCHKTDKASMLDDAIEYMKSLQMQIQMMSMCCNMAPMLFPSVQQYMPSVGMGIPMGMSLGMGLGMGLEMAPGGLSRPTVPFPTVMLAGAPMATAGAAHLSPRPPLQAFHAAAAALADQTRLQANNQTSQIASSAYTKAPGVVQMPNPSGLYYQVHPDQNGATAEPGTSNGNNVPEKPE